MTSGKTSAERLADLEPIYREHHAFVRRTLHHFGLRSPAIDDATQEVFLVVFRRLYDYDGRTSVRNWLYGIARRVASDGRKRREREVRRLHLVPDPERHATGDARAFERISAVTLVERFLDALDEDRRQIFIMAEVEGMTAPEIAELLGLNLNTVYARLRSARLLFKREHRRYAAVLQRESSDDARRNP